MEHVGILNTKIAVLEGQSAWHPKEVDLGLLKTAGDRLLRFTNNIPGVPEAVDDANNRNPFIGLVSLFKSLSVAFKDTPDGTRYAHASSFVKYCIAYDDQLATVAGAISNLTTVPPTFEKAMGELKPWLAEDGAPTAIENVVPQFTNDGALKQTMQDTLTTGSDFIDTIAGQHLTSVDQEFGKHIANLNAINGGAAGGKHWTHNFTEKDGTLLDHFKSTLHTVNVEQLDHFVTTLKEAQLAFARERENCKEKDEVVTLCGDALLRARITQMEMVIMRTVMKSRTPVKRITNICADFNTEDHGIGRRVSATTSLSGPMLLYLRSTYADLKCLQAEEASA